MEPQGSDSVGFRAKGHRIKSHLCRAQNSFRWVTKTCQASVCSSIKWEYINLPCEVVRWSRHMESTWPKEGSVIIDSYLTLVMWKENKLPECRGHFLPTILSLSRGLLTIRKEMHQRIWPYHALFDLGWKMSISFIQKYHEGWRSRQRGWGHSSLVLLGMALDFNRPLWADSLGEGPACIWEGGSRVQGNGLPFFKGREVWITVNPFSSGTS